MGTVIIRRHGIQVKRFYGGEHRGTCYAIGVRDGYVELTKYEYHKFIKDLVHWDALTKSETIPKGC